MLSKILWRTLLMAFATLALLTPGAAAGLPSQVAIDSLTPKLTEKTSGGHEVGLGFTNLTDTPIQLAAEPTVPDVGCVLRLEPNQLSASAHTDVTLAIPSTCAIEEDGLDFIVQVLGGPRFDVSAEKSVTKSPDWTPLWVYPITLIPAFLLLLFALYSGSLGTATSAQTTGSRFRWELPHLGATYSFGDSWVTNITAIAGLFTALFGTTGAASAILGSESDSSVNLAIVAAGITLAFISAGPLLLISLKTDREVDTAYGFVIASTFTITGAFGQLWIFWQIATKLDLGGASRFIPIVVFLFATALLAWFSIKTTRLTIRRGITEVPVVESDVIKAAKLVAAALNDPSGAGTIAELMETQDWSATSSGDSGVSNYQQSTIM